MHETYKLLYFVVFASLGVIQPYLPIFYELKTFSKSQIGILTMIPNIGSVLIAPVVSGFCDKYHINGEVIVFNTLFGVIFTYIMIFFNDYYYLLLIVVIASLFRSSITSQIDSLVISRLEDKHDYGNLRLFGAVSYGLLVLMGGNFVGDVYSFKYIFYTHAVFALCSAAIVLSIMFRFTNENIKELVLRNKFQVKKGADQVEAGEATTSDRVSKENSVSYALFRVFQAHPEALLFCTIVFLSGFGSGVIESFLFVRLKELGGSGLVMGLARLITCFSEVPMFTIAGMLQKRFGTFLLLGWTQLAFVIRFLYYSQLSNAISVLPCEVLHGVTFAITWSVSCTYADELSTLTSIVLRNDESGHIEAPNCHSTLQALLEGLHWGLGSGLGALIGGVLYDQLGATRLFQLSALLSAASMAVALATHFYLQRQQLSRTNSTASNDSDNGKYELAEVNSSHG